MNSTSSGTPFKHAPTAFICTISKFLVALIARQVLSVDNQPVGEYVFV